MNADLIVELAGEIITLLPERAMYWPRAETLFVADTHWGKDATFRAAAIAVPGGTLRDDLDRLGATIQRTGARRLIVPAKELVKELEQTNGAAARKVARPAGTR